MIPNLFQISVTLNQIDGHRPRLILGAHAGNGIAEVGKKVAACQRQESGMTGISHFSVTADGFNSKELKPLNEYTGDRVPASILF